MDSLKHIHKVSQVSYRLVQHPAIYNWNKNKHIRRLFFFDKSEGSFFFLLFLLLIGRERGGGGGGVGGGGRGGIIKETILEAPK
jgi:hypothetical protein